MMPTRFQSLSLLLTRLNKSNKLNSKLNKSQNQSQSKRWWIKYKKLYLLNQKLSRQLNKSSKNRLKLI